jgi:glucose/mannose-6-phosphate isomerase
MNRLDKSNMFETLSSFYKQFIEARKFVKHIPKQRIDSIVIAGMGGSGIGGDILKAYLKYEIRIPIAVVKNYSLPSFVKKNTLVFVCSYSGNTEETTSVYKEARKRRARTICIASGGLLEKYCKKDKVMLIKIPSGIPPRTALGYSFVPMLLILQKLGLVKNKDSEIRETARLLRKMSKELSKKNSTSEKLAKRIGKRIPIIYSSEALYPVTYRWSTEFNENSKCLAFSKSLPEQNHNEINAIPVTKADIFVIMIRDKKDNKRIQKRFKFLKKIIPKKIPVQEVWTRGNSHLARMFSAIYIGSFCSYYLAIMKGVDPSPVKVIEKLKKALKN